MKQFPYDVFLSHRIGDGANIFRDQLIACGCTVWFDENEPLRDRKVFSLIRKAHAESRVTIAFLSLGHAPSPWTILEMLTALRCERQFGVQCLFFYGPTEALELSHTWLLPEELCLALADPWRQLETAVPLFATRIRGLNREIIANSSVAPLSRARCIARLRRSISCFRDRPQETVDAHLSPELPEQITRRFMASLRLQVASAALDWLNGVEEEHEVEYQAHRLRKLERRLSEVLVDRTHDDVELLSSLCCCLIGAGRVNTRAEGMYLLGAMLLGTGERRVNRLLKWSLKREPDWTLIRMIVPEEVGPESQAWPGQFPGLEAALIQSDGYPLEDELKYVSPDVLMRIDPRRQMDPDNLPFNYRVELELHWLRMLLSQVREAREKQTNLDTFDARSRIQMIDVELLHRNLNALLAKEFSTANSTELEDVMDRIMLAERELIDVSECNDGAPLSSFSEYFIDHLLPILGLGVLIGRQPLEFKLLGERCLPIFSKYNRLRPVEIDAYSEYLMACLKYREAHGSGFASHLLQVSIHGFSVGLASFLIRAVNFSRY